MTSTVETTSIRTEGPQGLLGRVAGSPLLRLVVRRVLIAIPLLLAVSILTFALMAVMPGDPARNMAGMNASEEQVEAVRHQLGLDRPPVERYLTWLGGFVTGNLGKSSVSGQPVAQLLAERMPVTVELVLLAFAVSLLVSLPVALIAARRPGGIFDRVVMVISMTLLAVPNYVMALLLVLVFAVSLRALPAIGYVPVTTDVVANLRSVTLPVLALGLPIACFYARFLRGDLVEQMNSAEYIETARAKGVGPWKVLLVHAFRNSSFGLLTLVGLNVGGLVGGTVIIEQIFSMPGLGVMMLQGVGSQDTAVVQACVFIFAAVAIFANLFVDVMYAVLDPRIRYGSR
ncbi:ABC transporter permease [Microbacterium sp. SORGH_AS_0888]|uniref:ABC transporter permease n=1 Tax=Microbacterium sp. SORGH_AS_0888 TaxID=3041791 RepID=UPI00278A7A31|nr:ABC transporter permease [Microbacterium sp. SORGH_AS_0888]MDQ1129721.1 peptide/nickel transport system permease protein [Microbacterium sp. SORGH_AS_0888]